MLKQSATGRKTCVMLPKVVTSPQSRKELGMRIEKEVKLVKETGFYRRKFSGYGDEWVSIYLMSDGDTTYMWKTTANLIFEQVEENGRVDMYFPERGDVIKIRATIKAETEYNGKPQTEINRVKVMDVVYKYKEAKYEEQVNSLKGKDYIWHGMPYKQYKTSYSDCEVIIDSFNDHEGKRPATVDVIIREGRIKNSGTRGEKFAYYTLECDDGRVHTYKAVCEDNALNRAEKELGGVWCVKHIEDCFRGGWRDIWR